MEQCPAQRMGGPAGAPQAPAEQESGPGLPSFWA